LKAFGNMWAILCRWYGWGVRLMDKNWLEAALVGVMVAVYTLAASLISLHRYWQYSAFWYDLGIFDTVVWKLSRFQLPIVTQLKPPGGRIIWADHLNPSAVFLAPLYWFTDRQEVILVAQAVVVGLSALVAYRVALRVVKSRVMRVALVVSYLGFVGMQNALYTDVHTVVLAVLPLMLAIWAIYEERWGWYWLFLLITLGFQENMATVVAMLGLYLILRKERKMREGLMTLGLGVVYGLLAMKVLIPILGGGGYWYEPVIPTTWQGWATGLLVPMNMKLRTVGLTVATFGLLPLGSWSTAPLIVEHYVERFVLNTAATRWDMGFHYNAVLSPIMFLASLETIKMVQRRRELRRILPVWGGVMVLAVVVIHRLVLHGPLMLATHPVFYQQTKRIGVPLNEFTVQIPGEGLLMTQNNIAAHFTHREVMLLNEDFEKIAPEVIALDVGEGQNANNFFPLTPAEVEELAASVSASLNYRDESVGENYLLFVRK
jgi:uncharacterized membrane protein